VTIKNQALIWEGVTIHDDVFIGPRATFTNDRYPRSPRMAEAAGRYSSRDNWLSRTLVGKGAAIGAAAVICPGIELGPYCVIAAGAVVTKSVAPFSIVRGNPARPTGFVCSCGQVLSGGWDSVTCVSCGQSGQQRQALLDQIAIRSTGPSSCASVIPIVV
jgi:hypothetical protein